jgi:hypothetical protein
MMSSALATTVDLHPVKIAGFEVSIAIDPQQPVIWSGLIAYLGVEVSE